MNITIINDCRDANAVGRQVARTASVMPGNTIQFVGVSSDLEAAGNLIDILDTCGESESVVLVNVAPRNGKAKKWENGTPFGYFWYKKILVVSSIDGLTLSLIKKLGLIDVVHVVDIPTVVPVLVESGSVSAETGQYIVGTQFRSLEFVPRVAAYLVEHQSVVSTPLVIGEVDDVTSSVWWIDNFGNCKTTILSSDCAESDTVETRIGRLARYTNLKSVPDGVAALIEGSSGMEGKRFLEIVVQGGNASEILGIQSGSAVF